MDGLDLLPRGGNVEEDLYGSDAPFYHLVPKDPVANCLYRRMLWEMVEKDAGFAKVLVAMCCRDLLFYVNSFVVTYDPRKQICPGLPFITYPFQDEAFIALKRAVGCYDLPTEKSRDTGASWIGVTLFEWFWHFHTLQSFLLVSRKEDYVDKKGDPKSLFWKLDFIHKHLPDWLMPAMARIKLHLANLDNGSTIDGESTTGDVARGDRRTAILLDEFAFVENGAAVMRAVHDATNCVLANSTHCGTGTAFYREVKSSSRKLRLHWSKHPEKARGLYRSLPNGEIDIIDREFRFPLDYPFVVGDAGSRTEENQGGALRSVWYDIEDERRNHPREMAQEVDISCEESDFQYFDPVSIEELKGEALAAFFVGELEFDLQTLERLDFRECDGGGLRLWIYPDESGAIPPGDYAMGCDIAVAPKGSEASNTVFSIADMLTGEKVAEYVIQGVPPHETAKIAVALAKWFHNAFMIWEANGPGRTFGDVVVESRYSNIYYRTNDKSVTWKVSDIPGWWSGKDEKLAMLGHYRKCLGSRTFRNRSLPALNECLQYVFTQGRTIEHSSSIHTEDLLEQGDNHGDRVIADGLCCKIVCSMATFEEKKEVEMPVSCLARRKLDAERELVLAERW